jgi:nucleoside-diphosphate kinase
MEALMETTFVMIKPNAVYAGLIGAIIQRYESSRLAVAAIKIKTMTKQDCEGFYAEHVGKDFFTELVEFMCSGPSVLMALSGNDAVNVARQINGATDPAKATPGTIRYDYASIIGENVVHSSDCIESAAREVAFWFSADEVVHTHTPESRLGL